MRIASRLYKPFIIKLWNIYQKTVSRISDGVESRVEALKLDIYLQTP